MKLQKGPVYDASGGFFFFFFCYSVYILIMIEMGIEMCSGFMISISWKLMSYSLFAPADISVSDTSWHCLLSFT